MSLQLPPNRRLDHPDRMIDSILAEAEDAEQADSTQVSTLGRTRRTRFLLIAVAAAAVGVVGVVGVSVVGRGQQNRVADPPSLTAAAPTPSAKTPAAPVPSSPQSSTLLDPGGARLTLPPSRPHIVAVGTPVKFADFTVTVNQVQWSAAQGDRKSVV